MDQPQPPFVVVTGEHIVQLLAGKEHAVLKTTAEAYRVHACGDTALPNSSFLRFPNRSKERIIALPAYLGGQFQVAGIKWISSFPSNIDHGIERASAVLVLNSLETGRAYALLESSHISALRTAASAALAADLLVSDPAVDTLGVVGCGLINFQVLRLLSVQRPSIQHAVLFDVDPARSLEFSRTCVPRSGLETASIARSLDEVLEATTLISFATTATTPYVDHRAHIRAGTVILHVSLRDLTPGVILTADNVVDDTDHVCRANTSIHLAEQEVQHRDFIRCTLGEILTGRHSATASGKPFTVFSPFGLGILDLAVARFAYEEALRQGQVTVIDSFFPLPWFQR